MRPIPFRGADVLYTSPDPDVGDLHVQRIEPGKVLSVWELDEDERMAIAEGCDIELVICTEPIPPVALMVSRRPKLGDAPPPRVRRT